MPVGRDSDGSDGDQVKLPLFERLRNAMLKPADPDAPTDHIGTDEPMSVEELEHAVAYASDKERGIGLVAAPVAALIGILVIRTLISDDPPEHLKDGQLNHLYVSVSLYHTLALVLLGLSVAMLATAWFRKRLFLGIFMALYGLAIFNLHYWGFGIPFIIGAAWLLVRAYRLQRALKLATAGDPPAQGVASSQPSKRYTPPGSSRRS